jgi:hypothetical protein
MRFLLNILLTATLAFIAGLFLPWWSIALAAFGVALLLAPGPGRGFLCGFAGISLLWTVVALWADIPNGQQLSGKVAALFPLGGSSILLVAVTAFIGGTIGGFAAMAGASLRPAKKAKR